MEDEDLVIAGMRQVKLYLRQLSDLENTSRAYGRFILEHGREWQSQALPHGIRAGEMRRCYQNAQRLAFRSDRFTYVEGYACSGSLSIWLPVQHAWVVDAEGRVIDPTWRDPSRSAYFGIPFNTDYVRRTVAECRQPCAMIDNHLNKWELLRTPEIAAEAVLDFAVAEHGITSEVRP